MTGREHIDYIAIKNFKCFKHLELSNIRQVNLFLGDNNSGKTSLLEAILFDANVSQFTHNLQSLLFWRNIVDDNNSLGTLNPLQLFKNRTAQGKFRIECKFSTGAFSNFELVEESLDRMNDVDRQKLSLHPNFKGKEIAALTVETDGIVQKSFSPWDLRFPSIDYLSFVPFIPASAYYAPDLVDFFSKHFSEDGSKKEQLVFQLEKMVAGLKDIEISVNYLNSKPLIALRMRSGVLLPLAMFGDGTKKLFRAIMEIAVCRDQRLCIDEVDSGIHYSRFPEFIRNLLSTAKEYNVQLFLSTHNEEFLRVFRDVLVEEEMDHFQKKVKAYTLERMPSDDIKAFGYEYAEFDYAIRQGHELRGGR